MLSKDEVYIDQSGNVYIDQSGNVYIDQSGNVYIDQSGNVYIDQSGNTKLVFRVLNYQDIYRREHLSSTYIKTCKHHLYNSNRIFCLDEHMSIIVFVSMKT
jgi:hypothetical protein